MLKRSGDILNGRYLCLLILVVLTTFGMQETAVHAQKVQITEQYPRAVETGERFSLAYTANADVQSFRGPEIKDFRVLGGPSKSTSTSIQIINGKRTQTFSNSFTYYLLALKPGKFEIPPASMKIGNREFQSAQVSIEVVGEKKTESTEPSADRLPEDAVFVRILTSKSSVYQGEHLVATIKLYTRLPVSGFGENELPSFDGFWTQDIEAPTQISMKRENINGTIYNTGIIRKVLLFPQRSGTIEIEPFKLEVYVRQQSRNQGLFDDFFGPSFRNVSKRLSSRPVPVTVKPYPPGKPSSFTGGVGSFSLQSGIDKQELRANDPVTLTLTISGNGNLSLLEVPEIDFPPDFESYDPRVSTNLKNSASGQSGSKSYEYLLIPRFAGNYRIPPVEFTYFDPGAGKFRTTRTREYNISVLSAETQEGTGPAMIRPGKEVTELGQDILFIKTGKLVLREKGRFLFGSVTFWSIYLGSFLVFILIILGRRTQLKRNRNIELVKNRRASRQARKRLRASRRAMHRGERETFSGEILKALWGYLSDKLNIPVSDLSLEEVTKELRENSIGEEIINEFISLNEQCEYSRYAPAGRDQDPGKIYRDAVRIISKIEQNLKQGS